MAYLSDVVGKPVIDVEGENIGKVTEILAIRSAGMPHPRVSAVQVKHKKNLTLIPIADVAALIAPIVPLNKKIEEIFPYEPKEGEIYLARDILDKLIIDLIDKSILNRYQGQRTLVILVAGKTGFEILFFVSPVGKFHIYRNSQPVHCCGFITLDRNGLHGISCNSALNDQVATPVNQYEVCL
jgi:sporulation protein YlmC with PRC-barrel domain